MIKQIYTIISPHLPKLLWFLDKFVFVILAALLIYVIKMVINWGINQIKKLIDEIKIEITVLKEGQDEIQDKASKGRNIIHEKIEHLVEKKIDPVINDMTALKSQHAINHPGQNL